MVLKLAPLFCRFTWHCPPRLNGYQSLLLFKRPLTTAQETENTNASHSRFLAEASPQSRWKEGAGEVGKGGMEPTGEDFDTLTEGKGKLSPTSSHLFKLILPLGLFTSRNEPKSVANASKIPPPTVFLLHPSQPLSHVSRLILASLSPAEPSISFRSPSHRGDRHFQWSSSTDLGDFIRDAAQTHEFEICISNSPGAVSGFQQKSSSGEHDGAETIIQVEVPTFADRTRFLRRRLDVVTREMDEMNKLKHQCDAEARRGARRVAVGGFGLLVVYWGAVARLTFWDYGWDIMEPITYLSGLSTVILGYLWSVPLFCVVSPIGNDM
ncbi:hypothetical protein JAAARDRAFT_67856 [Jaapia argillacea MUCL 33604]|uniref:Calcium uniporter protein, mitochondrial n=1 Tax=Jaapia argillacea MUCL 33604 TaxID=933084 RepID=A0A067Q9U3_9AGAM|nr:hypothetical protein JAAARDRAFT_67856 [Jaapia argillacea MUCL 33604]